MLTSLGTRQYTWLEMKRSSLRSRFLAYQHRHTNRANLKGLLWPNFCPFSSALICSNTKWRTLNQYIQMIDGRKICVEFLERKVNHFESKCIYGLLDFSRKIFSSNSRLIWVDTAIAMMIWWNDVVSWLVPGKFWIWLLSSIMAL